MEQFMKKFLGLIILSLFFVIGCQENDGILESSNNVDNLSLSKSRPIFPDTQKLVTTSDVTDAKLKYTKTFTVDGIKGGKLFVDYNGTNSLGQKVNLSASLTIPRNAFQGTLTFDIIFDLENYGVELYPSPFTFDIPVTLNLLYSGMDLTGIDPNSFKFDYLDGEPSVLKYDFIKIDIANKFLEVSGAQIPHFSRYGWTRTTN